MAFLLDATVLGLQRGISIEVQSGRVRALRSPGAVYAVPDDDQALLGQWLGAVDGSRSLMALAERSGVPLEAVRASASDLYSAGLLAETGASEAAVDAALFYDHACTAAAIWAETVAERLGDTGAGGAVRGLVEHWHYVRTAPARLTVAARRARLAAARVLWAQLAAKEETWAHRLEAGLRWASGANHPIDAEPLPATAALCEQMLRAADADRIEDQLGYAACIGAACAADAGGVGLLAYYRRLAELDAAPAAMLAPFLGYAEFCADRTTSDRIRALFAAQPPLSPETRRIVLGHLAEHTQAIVNFHRNAGECYGDHC